MKKFITFCKSYLLEILFVFLTVLLICGFVICWQQFSGLAVGLCGAIAMLLEICIAIWLYSLLSRDRKSFKITHYMCFVLWAAVFVDGIILSADLNKEISVLFALSIVTFCALFSDFAAVTHFSRDNAASKPEDNCDDD